jgi:hypothetical protein
MKYLNYLLIVLGAAVAIYSEAGVEQNQYILIGGIVILMIGIYRISKNIPSRNKENEDEL